MSKNKVFIKPNIEDLMVRLGCVTESQYFSEGFPESEKLFEMWTYLANGGDSANAENEIPIDKLKLFSMVVLKVAEPAILVEFLESNNSSHGFNFEDAETLLHRFELFYINRIKNLAVQQVTKKAQMVNLQT